MRATSTNVSENNRPLQIIGRFNNLLKTYKNIWLPSRNLTRIFNDFKFNLLLYLFESFNLFTRLVRDSSPSEGAIRINIFLVDLKIVLFYKQNGLVSK